MPIAYRVMAARCSYKPSSAWSFKETIYYGPDQANTSMEFWRLFSDSIAEWKGDVLTLALEYSGGNGGSGGSRVAPRFLDGCPIRHSLADRHPGR